MTRMRESAGSLGEEAALPGWVPAAARHYLRHTEGGQSIREVARTVGCHASTVLRQIRRLESRRDDPLVDEALARLGECHVGKSGTASSETEEADRMTAHFSPGPRACDETTLAREARRVLRRLAEPGALLAVAPGMDKAAVLRETEGGQTVRTAVLERTVAEAFALQEWIEVSGTGRVARYRITATGRSALKRYLAEDAAKRRGMAESAAPFADQHRTWGTKTIAADAAEEAPRRMRYNVAESPVAALSRRRDKDGTPFLSPELVRAAERLREDFELAHMGPKVAQNWERFLTAGVDGGRSPGDPLRGPEGARSRVAAALRDLGPGLGDTALRVCCYLEGLEATERRMGWSARSGKIVLRIALQRLARHYEETYGPGGGLIG